MVARVISIISLTRSLAPSNPRSIKDLPLLKPLASLFRLPSLVFNSLQPLFPKCRVGWASRMLLRDTGVGYPKRMPALQYLHYYLMPSRTNVAERTSLTSFRSLLPYVLYLISFRINTCKSVSKQTTLSPFRINTCEKPGEGVPTNSVPTQRMRKSARVAACTRQAR